MPASMVRFHRLATREYLSAFDRYALIAPELAESFKAQVDKAVAKIESNPARWPILERNFRWIKIRRFPYVLYFQIVDDGTLVLAVAHARRRPGYWKKRANY